ADALAFIRGLRVAGSGQERRQEEEGPGAADVRKDLVHRERPGSGWLLGPTAPGEGSRHIMLCWRRRVENFLWWFSRSAPMLFQQRQFLPGQFLALRQVFRFILPVQADGAVELALLEPQADLVPVDDAVADRHHAVMPGILALLPGHVLDRQQ